MKNINKYTFLLTIGFIGLIIISLQSFLIISMESELAYHMIIEHSIFFLLGAMSIKIAEEILKMLIKYERKQKNTSTVGTNQNKNQSVVTGFTKIWSEILRNIFKTPKIGYIWLIISILILTFWHLPLIFDYSELHSNVHILQHISFIVVGMTGFLSLRALGESYKIFLILILSGMMGFMGLIFSVSDSSIFDVYSVSNHNYAGTWMVIVSIILLFIGLPLYTIKRTLSYTKAKT